MPISRFLPPSIAFFFLLPGLLWAQNYNITIQGPTAVCPGCYSYRAVLTAPGGTNLPVGNYKWTQARADGTIVATSADTVPMFCFYQSGIYKVSVEMSSLNGSLLGVTSIEVRVLPYVPVKIISSNVSLCGASTDSIDATDVNLCDRVCPNSTVVYSIEEPPTLGSPPPNISWSVVGADSFRVQEPQRTSVVVYWGASGSGAVSVVVFSSGTQTYCAGEASLCVTVVEAPQAAFEAEPVPVAGSDTVRICKGQTVWFDNRSQHAERYEWRFSDDLSVETSVHAQHTFLQPGVFGVQLVAISGCLCTDTVAMWVEVLDAESPTLECVGDLCAGATATYRASANCSGLQWSVSANGTVVGGGFPGADSVTVQWGIGPVGSIQLLPQACAGTACPFPTVVRIPLIDNHAAIQGRERVCPDAEEVYTIEPYGGTAFTWNLSSGGTIVEGQGTPRVVVRWGATANPNAVHRLSVQYDNCYLGCGGSDTLEVRILSPFYLNGPAEACAGSAASFLSRLTANNQNLSSHWSLLGPDGAVVWTSPSPSASVLAPLPSQAGYYRMRAVPANPLQTCTEVREWGVRVPAPPAAPAGIDGPSAICPGQTFTYSAEGLPVGANVRWTVQNGPGAPTTLLGNPINVTWGATGPYRLSTRQLSGDGLGCTSDSAGLLVQALSGASIVGPDTLCVAETAAYALSGPSGLAVQWSVSPSDAGTITAGQGTAQATIFWPNGGTYLVRASVCGQSAERTVVVSPTTPATVLHPAALCAGESAVVRTAQTYAHYTWRSADNHLLSVADTALLGPGSYVLEATDARGCPVRSAFTIAQRATPYVVLSTNDPTAFCTPQPVQLQAVVSSGAGLTYEWFRDGIPVGTNAPTYIANQFGQYTVRATNALGCSATAGPVAIVQDCGGGGGGAPIPGGAPPCSPGQVTLQVVPSGRCDSLLFQAGGTDYLSGSAEWFFFQWGKGVSATDSGDVVRRVFSEVGFHNVLVLARTSSSGQVCYLTASFSVEAVARFWAPSACAGEAVAFEDESSHLPLSSISAWMWNFGNPSSGAANTSALREPTHVFANGGTYLVRLTITAQSGCTATALREVAVHQPAPPLIAAPASGCEGNALAFTGSGENLRWDFGDPSSGALNTATGSPAYHVFTPGTYTVTASSTDVYGCTATTTHSVNITANTLMGTVNPSNPAPLCEGSTLILTAPPGGTLYEWSNGANGSALNVTQEGVYRVTMTDANGCTYAPPPVPVRFIPSPEALIKAAILNELGQTIDLAYPSHSVCAGDEVFLIAQGQGNLTFSWSTGATGTRVEFSRLRDTLLPIGTHLYTITITDQATGCTAVSPPFTVNVRPVPSGFSVANTTAPPCAGTINTLQYNGPNLGNWQFVWNTGQTGVPLVTEQAGHYVLRVINEFGCEARSVPITVLPGPRVSAVPAGCHARCRPDTLCLPNLPDITAWQWLFNGSPIAGATSPTLVPNQSGTYQAVLTDVHGCTNTSRPLTLQLFDGFGHVLGRVWADVNGNGMVDVGDTVANGIPVRLWQAGNAVGSGISGADGTFAFAHIPTGTYVAVIDTNALPPGWKAVVAQAAVDLVGCDVSREVFLLVRPVCSEVRTGSVQLSACAGTSAIYNGTAIPAGSTQTFLLTTADGCDSLVAVTVTELAATSRVLNVSACSGEVYEYNGVPIAAGSSEVFVLTNAAGCDSFLTVVVSELPVTSGVLNVSACSGEVYEYNGVPIAAGSSEVFTLTNAAGCDSFLTVVVSELPTTRSVLRAGACPGQSFVYQGVALPIGTTQDFIFTNSQGCDSIVTVIVSALTASQETLSVQVCPGEVFLYNGVSLSPGEVRTFVFVNSAGCDSIVVVEVSAFPSAVFDIQAQASCAGSGTGSLTVVQPSGGRPPYMYSLDGAVYQSEPRFSGLSPGPYFLRLKDGNGCVFERAAEVPTLSPLSVVLTEEARLPCSAEGVVLRPTVGGTLAGLTYQWSTGSREAQIEVLVPGVYTLEVSNVCERVERQVRVQWEDERADAEFFYVPNVFAPDATDPDNAQFRPYPVSGLAITRYHLEIFDRWGNLVFRTSDPQEGWRGPFRSVEIQPAVFVWYLSAEVDYCGRLRPVFRKGDVTVMR